MLVQNFDAAFDPKKHHPAADGCEPDAHIRDTSAKDYGSQGWFHDVISLVKPWGFSVSRIQVPVLLWHGERDSFSPIAHFHWLADHIKHATAMLALNTAHFGAIPAMPRILRWLASTENRQGAGSRR